MRRKCGTKVHSLNVCCVSWARDGDRLVLWLHLQVLSVHWSVIWWKWAITSESQVSHIGCLLNEAFLYFPICEFFSLVEKKKAWLSHLPFLLQVVGQYFYSYSYSKHVIISLAHAHLFLLDFVFFSLLFLQTSAIVSCTLYISFTNRKDLIQNIHTSWV